MLTFNFYEHKQRNGESFFTAYLVTTRERKFLWFKWTVEEKRGVLRDGAVCKGDWYASKFKTLEEARKSCAQHSEYIKKEENEMVVKKELIATDTLYDG
jgi:hypothetical protein